VSAGSNVSVDVAERARAFRRAQLLGVCDVTRPWAHGTVLRATRFPGYYQYNLICVEGAPELTVESLIAAADRELEGLAHRRIDFEQAEVGEPLRSAFHDAGWRSTRVVWMRHGGAVPDVGAVAIEEVPYDDVAALRVAWDQEDHPGQDVGAYHEAAREISLRREARVLVAKEGKTPIGFAQLERCGDSSEIGDVYVRGEYRKRGLGAALTAAAIAAAPREDDLWITADDEYVAKRIYERLGFEAVETTMEVTLWP
jgi:GNAT superfamily N-acetyltransferase